MKYDFLTIGGAVIDRTVYVNDSVLVNNKKDVLRQKLIGFEYGAKVMINESDEFFGGGANNAVVSLARLGFKTAILASVGVDNYGEKILKNLRNNKVDVKFVKKIRGEKTGYSIVIITKDGEHIILLERGANNFFHITSNDIKVIKNSLWTYVSSLTGDWKLVLDKVFENKNKIVWNPGSTQVGAGVKKIKKYLKRTDILIVNKDEAIEFVVSDDKYRKKANTFLNNKKNLFNILKSYGSEVVVITDGAKGVDVYDGINFYHEDSIVKAREIKDTTGVGDAFNSSFTAGVVGYKGDIAKAMKLGIKNVASVLKKPGGQNGLIKLRVK